MHPVSYHMPRPTALEVGSLTAFGERNRAHMAQGG
jgi:hypothetical protein